jgi:hypothetical protein
MLPSAFHALSRNYPDLRIELDFAPPRAQTFAGASCGEDREFERPRRHARPVLQSGQEAGNVIKGESGMMLDPPNSGARREDMGEVPFPLCRVRPLAEAAHGRCIKHSLDPTAHSTCCFGFLRPDRIENLDDESGVDRGDGQFTQYRIDVAGERVAPLLPVFRVALARLVAPDELLGHLAEGAAPGQGKPPRLPLSCLCFQRVYFHRGVACDAL